MIENKKLDYETGEIFSFTIQEYIDEKFPDLIEMELAVENISYFNWDKPAYFVFARSSDMKRYVEFIIDNVEYNGQTIFPLNMTISSHGFPVGAEEVWRIDYDKYTV